MGTVNPVVVTRAGAGNLPGVAAGFVGSFTLGHGQFCTKPGLLLAPAGAGAADAVAAALREAGPAPVMLTDSHRVRGQGRAGRHAGRRGDRWWNGWSRRRSGWAAPAAVLARRRGRARGGRSAPRGVLRCGRSWSASTTTTSSSETALAALQGSLAASVVTGGADDPQAAGLVASLSEKVGRVVVDDWPTGVAFTWAQQHGGPWPSTTAPSATSVGAQALDAVRPAGGLPVRGRRLAAAGGPQRQPVAGPSPRQRQPRAGSRGERR